MLNDEIMNDECIQEEGLITMSMGLACEVVGCAG